MDEQFSFTPTAQENQEALRSLARSMTAQANRPVVRAISCLAVYGLPLLFAFVFFRDSFEPIYLTFGVFLIILTILSRIGLGFPSAIAKRFAVPQKVQFKRNGVTQDVGRAFVRWRWDSLSRLHVGPTVVMLEFSDWSWVPLPSRLWPNVEARERFIESVRAKAPNLLHDLPSAHVPTPFSLINVGAGFAAMDLFLLQVFGVTWVALSPTLWPGVIQFAIQRVPGDMPAFFLAALSVAIFGFFVIRRALRALQRRSPRATMLVANLFIWPVPVGLVFTAFRCGC